MKKSVLVLGGVGLLGGLLYWYFKRQANLLQQYSVDIVGVKFNTISTNNVNMVISVKLTNVADIEAKVNKMYMDVAIEGKNAGYVINEKPFSIPAKGYNYIDLNIAFNPKLILTNILGITLGVAQNKDIKIDLNGYANISSGFLSTTLPIKYSTTLKEYFNLK
jgi:LEA14-like dessication related protein